MFKLASGELIFFLLLNPFAVVVETLTLVIQKILYKVAFLFILQKG